MPEVMLIALGRVFVCMGLKLGSKCGVANSVSCWLLSICIWGILVTPILLISSVAKADQAADLQALFLKAFGKKKKAIPSQFTVDMTIDGQSHESVMVFNNNKQQVTDRVKAVDLIPQLKPILKEDVFLALKKALGDTKEVSFAWLAEHDIKAIYDTAALSLNLTLDPEQREPLILSLLHELSSSVRKENKVEASRVSGYLNLYTNTDLSFQDGERTSDVQFQLDGSLTVSKATLESQLKKSNDEWALSNTYITYDEPDKLRRYRVGEVESIQQTFQESVSLIGVSLRKDFSLDSSQEAQPRASEKLILSTRSEVVVLLNNFQIERFTLAPGTYLLEDIGLSDGRNDLTLKIIDAFGKETTKTSFQLFDNRLLKRKLSQYSFAVGVLDDDTDQFAVSGVYQYGLSDTLTIAGDAQLVKDNVLVGLGMLRVVNAGAIKSDMALSRKSSGDTGAAISVAFKPSFERDKQQVRWEAGGEIRSKQFTTSLGEEGEVSGEGGLRSNLNFKASKTFNEKWNTSLSLNHSSFYGEHEDFTWDLSTSRRLGKGISLSTGVNYSADTDWSVKAQLSVPLGKKNSRRKRVGVLANSRDNSFETRYEIKALNSIGRDSLSGKLIHRKSGSSSEQRAEGAIRMPRFESHVSLSHTNNDTTDQQRLQFGLNTSLACAGKACAVTYPIENSFALVSGPKNQEQAIALNTGNRRFVYADDEDSVLPINYSALIPKRGSHAVIHLEDYQVQRISADEISLPFGYNPEKTEFEASTGFHHGFSFSVAGEPGTVVDGILVGSDGKRLGFKGGQWISAENKDMAIAFFSNKSGRFRVPSMVPGRYRLELHDYPDMEQIEVEVTSHDSGIQDLGDVTIRL